MGCDLSDDGPINQDGPGTIRRSLMLRSYIIHSKTNLSFSLYFEISERSFIDATKHLTLLKFKRKNAYTLIEHV